MNFSYELLLLYLLCHRSLCLCVFVHIYCPCTQTRTRTGLCTFLSCPYFFSFFHLFFPPYLFFTVSPFLTTFKGSLLLWLNGVLNDSNDHVTWMHYKDVTAGTVPYYKCLRTGKFCYLLCTEIVRCEFFLCDLVWDQERSHKFWSKGMRGTWQIF